DRVLQCVAPFGFDSSVVAIRRSTSLYVIFRGAPGRGSSSNPSKRLSTDEIHVSMNFRLRTLAGGQQPGDADVDVGAHRVPEATHLGGGDAELLPEADPHGAVQVVTDGGEPA